MADQMAGIGDRLKSVRMRRGMTQRELAPAAGVSLSLVKKLEHLPSSTRSPRWLGGGLPTTS